MSVDALVSKRTFRLSSLAAIVLAASAPTAHAQSDSESCLELRDMIVQAGDRLRAEFSDAALVVERGDIEECNVYVARVADAGGIIEGADGAEVNAQAIDSETEEVSETVQIEQAATIEGEVNVTLPDPEVNIEQSPAEIAVRSGQPDVTIDQAQPQITVRQAQPIITVEMAQPTITVEQPAPEIIVTMPAPGVNVASAQPTVEVNIPEPRVTVRQGEPQLNVDLEANAGEVAERDPDLERLDDNGVMTVSKSGMGSDSLEPVITFVDEEGEPNVSFNQSSPEVEYVAADPDVRFSNEGEPSIEVVQSGEPKIVIQDQEQDSAAMTQPLTGETEATTDTAAVAVDQRDPRDAFAADPSDSAFDGAASASITVQELDGLDVINGRGEELGSVERVVRNGTDTYLIVEHGGWFLGLNDKEVAFPIDTVMVRNDNVILRGMTEEQIESMPDYDYANEINLGGDESVELMSIAE